MACLGGRPGFVYGSGISFAVASSACLAASVPSTISRSLSLAVHLLEYGEACGLFSIVSSWLLFGTVYRDT